MMHNLRSLLATLVLVASSFTILAQTIAVEIDAIHDSGELEGNITYRLYAVLDDDTDRLTSISGDESMPETQQVEVSMNGTFWKHPQAPTGMAPLDDDALYNDNNSSYRYSSFFTIGNSLESAVGNIAVLNDPDEQWDLQSSVLSWNSALGSIVSSVRDDFNPNTFPDDMNRVFIGQITTTGVLSGNLCMQIVPNEGPSGPVESTITCSSFMGPTNLIEYEHFQVGVQLFPNPASETVNINIATEEPLLGWSVVVYDISGMLVSRAILQESSATYAQMDISNLMQGVYIVELSSPGGEYAGQQRLVK